jgi:serine/threonine protein kinase
MITFFIYSRRKKMKIYLSIIILLRNILNIIIIIYSYIRISLIINIQTEVTNAIAIAVLIFDIIFYLWLLFSYMNVNIVYYEDSGKNMKIIICFWGDRMVVLKELLKDDYENSKDSKIVNFKHPNIIDYIGEFTRIDKENKKVYRTLVMEYAKYDIKDYLFMKSKTYQGSIKKILKSLCQNNEESIDEESSLINKMNCKNEITIFIQILDGLIYLRDKKKFHRDLKCANIRINHLGIVKIIDFGILKEGDIVGETTYRGAKGTYLWMSPEVP